MVQKNAQTPDPEWGMALPLPMWRVDARGHLAWCNAAYAALFGLEIDAAIDQNKILSPDHGARLHVTQKGVRKLYAVTLTDMAGDGRIGTAVDISREEELGSAHKRTQAATKELLEQLSTAVASFTAEQKIEFYNTAFAHLWGLDEAYLATKPKLGDIMERLRDARRLPEQADFRRYKQSWLDMFTGLIDGQEDMMHLPDGKTLRMLVVPNPAGGLMFTFEDVTSRLELETSYNTRVAVQRETLDNLHEGIAVFGGDGRLKLCNPSFGSLWGMNPEDLAGEPHITEIAERMRPTFAADHWDTARNQVLDQVLSGAESSGRMVLDQGRLIAYRSTVLPDGGMLLSQADVTDGARVEMALRDKNAALEAAERLKLDFLANVSYQLRTPLNAIMGFTEILDHQYFGELNDKQKQYTSGTREASEKLLGLIDDILDLSTIEAGYMKLDYDDVDVVMLLQNLQTLTQEWARKEGLDVSLDIHGNPGRMVADPRRLKQILVNLIRNAITFSGVGGSILIGAEREQDTMRLWVGDHGMGIAVDDQTRVLEPFARGQNANIQDGRRGTGGAGLGLTLVKNITALHGGRMVIDSAPKHGTTVTLTLPLKPT